jgi:hypothetical protein
MESSSNPLLRWVMAVLCTLATIASSVVAGNNPVDEPWWPSEFGADDQAGAVQYITPEKRLAAVHLVKKGKTATLGMPYYNGMLLVPGRTYALSIPGGGTPTHGPLNWPGEHFAQTFMDELLTKVLPLPARGRGVVPDRLDEAVEGLYQAARATGEG